VSGALRFVLLLGLWAGPAAAADPRAVAAIEAAKGLHLCVGCDLSGAAFPGKHLGNANFVGADLTGADLEGAYLGSALLEGASLKDARLTRANLAGASLLNADLSGARLTRSYLHFARMRGATWGDADLTGAILRKTDLTDTDVSRVRGATAAQWAEACGERVTGLPPGVMLRPCP